MKHDPCLIVLSMSINCLSQSSSSWFMSSRRQHVTYLQGHHGPDRNPVDNEEVVQANMTRSWEIWMHRT